MTDSFRIAIVGCGAIADVYHLPALAAHPATRDSLVLVDPDTDRLAELAARYGASQTAVDFRTVLDRVDGVIIAAPHHLHHPIALACLENGLPVLCEKPLTITLAAARELVDAGTSAGVPLCVNQTRRLFPAYRHIKALLDDGAIGRLQRLHYADGKRFRWPTKTGFYFRAEAAHGVLLDKGVHGLDTICWWLGGRPDVIMAQTDSFGGPEAVARLQLDGEGCAIEVAFSWLAQLHNSFAIVGEEGHIRGDIEAWDRFYLTSRAGGRQEIRLPATVKAYNDFGQTMIANFVDVIAGRAAPLVPAASVLPVVDLIEDCYRRATPFDLPWLDMPELVHG